MDTLSAKEKQPDLMDFKTDRDSTGKIQQSSKVMTAEEYFNRIAESRKAIGKGKLITQQEAIEKFRRKNG